MMNKKTKTKILTLSAISALSLAAIWVLASNPKLEFDREVKQDAHLELSGVTLIAPTQSSNFDVSFKMSWDQLITLTGTNTAGNSVQGNGTLSFWGNNNKTNDSESLILGGSSNEIANTAKANIIAASQWVKTAGEGTTNFGKGNVILASSGVNLTGNSNILRAGNSTKIHGNDNLTLATDKVNISANNSMAIGGNITINHNGSFVFNGTPDPVTTRKPNTAIINTSNGMIINANANTTTNNTGLTVNGSLQVGNSQIDTDGAIISDGCIKLKGISNGEIGLGCRNSSNTDGPFLSFEEVECGRNAKHYEINDRQTTWPLGSKNSDFCLKGTLDGQTPTFFTQEDRTAAYKTRGGSYASEGFGYTFHICFSDQDPTCALPKLKKSWTCSDAKGNRLHCQATQDLGKKDPKQTPVSCPSGQHLENGKCISNTKTVDCDKTWINTANGSVNTSQVAITRSESTKSWSKPAKCDVTCNTGFKKSSNSNWNNISCVKLEIQCLYETYTEQIRWKQVWSPSCHKPWWCWEIHHEIWQWPPKIVTSCRNKQTKEKVDISNCNNQPTSCNSYVCAYHLKREFNSSSSSTRVPCPPRDPREPKGDERCEWPTPPSYEMICVDEKDKLVPMFYCTNQPVSCKTHMWPPPLPRPPAPLCPPSQHKENGKCISNTKTVNCDETGINTANGRVNTSQVTITRSEATKSWSKPAKCDVTCNAGYEKKNGKCVKKWPKLRWELQEPTNIYDGGCGWWMSYEDVKVISECDTTPPTKSPQKLWERIDAWMYREEGACVEANRWGDIAAAPRFWGGYEAACYREAVEDK